MTTFMQVITPLFVVFVANTARLSSYARSKRPTMVIRRSHPIGTAIFLVLLLMATVMSGAKADVTDQHETKVSSTS